MFSCSFKWTVKHVSHANIEYRIMTIGFFYAELLFVKCTYMEFLNYTQILTCVNIEKRGKKQRELETIWYSAISTWNPLPLYVPTIAYQISKIMFFE